jgi:hypothetical protein
VIAVRERSSAFSPLKLVSVSLAARSREYFRPPRGRPIPFNSNSDLLGDNSPDATFPARRLVACLAGMESDGVALKKI